LEPGDVDESQSSEASQEEAVKVKEGGGGWGAEFESVMGSQTAKPPQVPEESEQASVE